MQATWPSCARSTRRPDRRLAAGACGARTGMALHRLAGPDRGVPRVPAGDRRHAGRHPARGRHAPRPGPRLSERVGATVWLKFEGVNPTGSFKDRGMTMAITKAVEEGAKAVVCASTGNTSASAAAYAARAGLACAVLIPEGHIALGKLAQALVHGARVLQVRGNFDEALTIVRELPSRAPSPSSTRSTPTASRARRPGPSRSSTCSATRPTSTASRSATPATSPPTGRAICEYQAAGRLDQAARDARLPGRRGRADRARPPGRAPRDHRHRHPDRQPGQLVPGRPRRPPSRAGPSPRSPTRRSLTPTASWPSRSRCSARPPRRPRWPGCSSAACPTGSTVVCVLTGHGLKDPDLAISQISVPHGGRARPRRHPGRALGL